MKHAQDPNARLHRKLRIRVAIFLLAAIGCVVLLDSVVRAINTINRLDEVKSERDHWQTASEVIAALQLQTGSAVADLGSGAGYFALKLSRTVGARGRVVAVDIRRLPLAFLWFRGALSAQHNIRTQLGDADDPHLPSGGLDGVLIANTYHELSNPASVLIHILKSLKPGGRLVVLDRSLVEAEDRDGGSDHHHKIDEPVVVRQVHHAGFEIISQEDHFINRPDGEPWWLIIARLPNR